jgi:hypothetical protein
MIDDDVYAQLEDVSGIPAIIEKYKKQGAQ